jgi:phenylalanyl-tRNA synthetase beta chain
MICDGRKPVAVGGVMGGMNSEIEPDTTRVLLESAYFTPTSIRKTAKRLGINSDASHRFERGVDPQGTRYALDRATQLMVELGNGNLVEGCIDVAYDLPQPPTLDLSVAATNRLLGTDAGQAEMSRWLTEIEFRVESKTDDVLVVETPSFRVDVSRPQDLMEEVARRLGYDSIPVTFPALPATIEPPPKLLTQRQRMRDLLVGMGFSEALNYSFVHADSCRRLRLPAEDLRCRQLAVLNPLSEDQAVMRTSLIPGMLETMQRNLSHQSRNLKLFETGKIFISRGSDQQPEENDMLAALWTGNRAEHLWQTKSVPCDFYDLKGVLEGLLEGLQIPAVRFTRLEPDRCAYTAAGESAKIVIDGTEVGIIGRIHPKVGATYDLKQDAFIFELDMTRLMPHIPEIVQFKPLPKYPATARDATLIVEEHLEAIELLSIVEQLDEPLVEAVRLFDVFQGAPIAAGYKSVSLRIVYRAADQTLEDETVNQLHKRITDRLVDHFKAGLPT